MILARHRAAQGGVLKPELSPNKGGERRVVVRARGRKPDMEVEVKRGRKPEAVKLFERKIQSSKINVTLAPDQPKAKKTGRR